MTREEYEERLEKATGITEELKHLDNLPDDTPATIGMIREMLKLQGAKKSKRFHESLLSGLKINKQINEKKMQKDLDI